MKLMYVWGVAALFALGAISWVTLCFVPAPYGRHLRAGWGPTLPARWAWVLMELPSPACFAMFFVWGGGLERRAAWLFAVMWLGHYLYRTFIYPLRMRASGQRKPWLTAGLAIVFNCLNGGLNGWAVSALAPHLTTAWFGDPRFVAGALLFVVGFGLHVSSDAILRSLRRPGESGYRIPYGGGFRFVSCPNYLGEIIQWVGYAVASWTMAGAAFAFFTVANLFPRALTHHRWYRDQFDDYPQHRRAIMPFLI